MAHLNNQSDLVSSQSTRGVKDPKFNVLALLRNHALDLNGIMAQGKFVGFENSDLEQRFGRTFVSGSIRRVPGKGERKRLFKISLGGCPASWDSDQPWGSDRQYD